MNSDLLVYTYAALLIKENPHIKSAATRALHYATIALKAWPVELFDYTVPELANEILSVAVLKIRDSDTVLESHKTARINHQMPDDSGHYWTAALRN